MLKEIANEKMETRKDEKNEEKEKRNINKSLGNVRKLDDAFARL